MRKQNWENATRYMMADQNIFSIMEVSNANQFKHAISIGGNIEITDDIDLSEAIIAENCNVTINLNNHTIKSSRSVYIPKSVSALICAKEGANITIEGKGTIDGSGTDDYGVETRGGNITIKDGKIIGATTSVYSITGDIEILGGEFQATPYKMEDGELTYRYTINLKDENGKDGLANIKIRGGKFYNFDPSNNLSENPAKNYVDGSYTTNQFFEVIPSETN